MGAEVAKYCNAANQVDYSSPFLPLICTLSVCLSDELILNRKG